MGVWVLAASWCIGNLSDGFIPASVLPRWGTKADAKRLVDVGLWEPAEQDGERGWRFHDWLEYQPDARTLRLKQSDGGAFGNHQRWHVNRKRFDPECQWCKESSE